MHVRWMCVPYEIAGRLAKSFWMYCLWGWSGGRGLLVSGFGSTSGTGTLCRSCMAVGACPSCRHTEQKRSCPKNDEDRSYLGKLSSFLVEELSPLLGPAAFVMVLSASIHLEAFP